MTTIPLGFEVATGVAVEIPLAHTFVTGQTQLSGKTTTLRAIVERSGQRALAFVTKRGEEFAGRRIMPYLPRQGAQPIHWRLVETILASALGERKLKYERLWIINAAKGALSLQHVRDNVDRLLAKTKGQNSRSLDAYVLIREYLDLVLPDMRALAAAETLDLQPGLNVMDLTGVGLQLQALVIRAALEHINLHESGVLTVFPEAWEFAPRGRSAPAKDEAIAMIRKGAVLKNFLLCDSQDIAGVDTVVRQGASVWILGVQRELNELRRTIQMIPAGIKRPKPEDVAQLELGEFYACWGRHAIRTYVQPGWMPAGLAWRVATGQLDVGNATAIAGGANVMKAARAVFGPAKEESVTKAEAAQLTRENETLLRQNAELKLRIEALEKGRHEVPARGRSVNREGDQQRSAGDRDRYGAAKQRAESPRDSGRSAGVGPAGSSTNGHVVDEALYQAIRARILEDEPILLKVLTTHPELVVEVTPRVMTVEGDSMKGRVTRLMAKGWFDQARETGDVRKELARTGTDPGGGGTLGIMLNRFVSDGFFVREGAAFVLAPGVKVSERELRVS